VNKHPNWLWIIALALGWVFDFLFWNRSIGANFAIFIALTLVAGFCLLVASGHRPAPKSLWLIAPLAFFAIMTFSRSEPLTLFLAYTFTLFSVGVLAVTYLGGRWMQYSLLDYFYKFFLLLGSTAGSPISFFSQVHKERIERGETRRKLPVTPILRGLLIALPIVICFATLLASADRFFSQNLADFFALFNTEHTVENTLRLIIILFWANVLAGAFLYAASRSQDDKLLGEEHPIIKPFLGFTESAIVLGSVSLLFLLFVIVQFRYFFGGNINISMSSFTYSQYARRGFNELIMVAFFSLVMILGLSTVTRRESSSQKRIYSGLSITLVALVLVILVSAYQRIALAIDWHGFSRLRLYPQVSLIWIGILFLAVVVLEILHRERYFALAVVLASLGFAVSLGLFNVDDAIARHNIERAAQGRHFNAPYLATLSVDAVPALASELTDLTLPASVREGIGAALLCQQYSGALTISPDADWRSFNLSTWNARQALASVKTQLASYHVNTEHGPIRVRTPGNFLYECIDTESTSGD
jgi:hypothetical protein